MKRLSGEKFFLKWKDISLRVFLIVLISLEIFFIFSLSINNLENISGSTGSPNATINSNLTVGNSAPQIISINTNVGNSINLIPNSTKELIVSAIILDYNGQEEIENVSIRFFDQINSLYSSLDDNNYHYTNESCSINYDYGDVFLVEANCSLNIEYYAANSTWNLSVLANETYGFWDFNSTLIKINSLLAVGLPDSLDFGIVNASAVSDEKVINVTNFGNVKINLSLSGYGNVPGDNNALNCSLGSIKNISINYAKYNLSYSNTSFLNLEEFELSYTNLTKNPITRNFGLDFRQLDANAYFDDTNSTYWRIYVPLGVAGTCNGNIVIGATESA